MTEQRRLDATSDARHTGRVYDKELPIDQPGMEMAKPGLPDLRRRKFTVPLPRQLKNPEAEPLRRTPQ